MLIEINRTGAADHCLIQSKLRHFGLITINSTGPCSPGHSTLDIPICLESEMASDQPSRKQNILMGIMAAAALGSLVLQWALVSYSQVDTIPFSQFEQLVAEGSVTEVTVGQDIIQVRVKDKLPSGKSAF